MSSPQVCDSIADPYSYTEGPAEVVCVRPFSLPLCSNFWLQENWLRSQHRGSSVDLSTTFTLLDTVLNCLPFSLSLDRDTPHTHTHTATTTSTHSTWALLGSHRLSVMANVTNTLGTSPPKKRVSILVNVTCLMDIIFPGSHDTCQKCKYKWVGLLCGWKIQFDGMPSASRSVRGEQRRFLASSLSLMCIFIDLLFISAPSRCYSDTYLSPSRFFAWFDSTVYIYFLTDALAYTPLA